MKRSSLCPRNGNKRVRYGGDENMDPTEIKVRPKPSKEPLKCISNFVPVSNYEEYLSEMAWSDKRYYDTLAEPYKSKIMTESETTIEKLRTCHIDYYLANTFEAVMDDTAKETFIFAMNSKNPNGIAPFEILDRRYTKNGRSIPISERIKALSSLGASREFLEQEMVKHDNIEKWKKEADKVLDYVFAKYGKSKSKAKPKKKSMFDSMTKYIIKAMVKLDISDTED